MQGLDGDLKGSFRYLVSRYKARIRRELLQLTVTHFPTVVILVLIEIVIIIVVIVYTSRLPKVPR